MHRNATIVFVLWIAGVAAQEPVFRAGVSMVEVDAQVIGKSGVIDGLSVGDFVVKDRGRLVSLRYCAQDDPPLDLALLL
jgi:hypothetical protein